MSDVVALVLFLLLIHGVLLLYWKGMAKRRGQTISKSSKENGSSGG